MAAGVLATMPWAAGVPATEDLPNVVFAAALVTILIFAVGFPQARRGMIAAAPPAVPGPAEPAAARALAAPAGSPPPDAPDRPAGA
jgi:hypothetical protein